MGVENFDQQSYADAFDRNLEGMRVAEVKEALGFMVEEVSGIPQEPLQGEQIEALHGWDVWLDDLFPKMDADKAKAHEIKPWEFRQFEK